MHISEKNAKALGITEYQKVDEKGLEQTGLYQPVVSGETVNAQQPLLYSTALLNRNHQGQTATSSLPVMTNGASNVGMMRSTASSRRRTNFVTSDNYDPEAKLREIDDILSNSHHGSRVVS